MILVFGGTTEGKLTAKLLDEIQRPFLYSTKTKTVGISTKNGININGALDEQQMISLCKRQEIDLVIDATHPFAEVLHRTVASVAGIMGIPSIRYERPADERQEHALVHYIKGYDEALSLLNDLGNPPLLALSGVHSIPKLYKYWHNYITYFRILDQPGSKAIAGQYHFPTERLVYSYPPKELASEEKLYKKLDIGAILTKESGKSGKLSIKIAAAIAAKVPILVIEKPVLPAYDFTAYQPGELKNILTHALAL